MKTAIIHDWLTGMRGGERVLEIMCQIFPDAPIFTLFHFPGAVSEVIESHPIITSRLQKLPFVNRNYRLLLPFFPSAIESFDLSEFDLIVSTSHAVAKGAVPPEHALSVCYCHTPMRYIWDMYDAYLCNSAPPFPFRIAAPAIRDFLRHWDKSTSWRVNHFIANSRFIAHRIKSAYNRNATVIHPPVNTRFYTPNFENPEDFYLIVSAFAPYKRIDLAIDAFNKLGKKLVVIGSGTQRKQLESQAGQTIEFKGYISDEEVCDHYRRCRALIFPGIEDFGLTPLEAQACGRPVIALAQGGALESVVEGVTGHFFHEPTPEALIRAVEEFETMHFDSEVTQKRAFEFDTLIMFNTLKRYFDKIIASDGLNRNGIVDDAETES